MQTTGSTEVNSGLTPQVRELIRTIVNASTALKRLLPDEEFEHGFEFHWRHSNSVQVKEMPAYPRSCLRKTPDYRSLA
jgi:hypothetical protein